MRYALFMLIVVGFCCSDSPKQRGLHDTITGNWFVLYQQETVMSEKQEKLYASIEDSLELLKNLKLISFSEKGGFKQMDSFFAEGRWGTKEEEVVYVNDGGNGFENFRTNFEGFDGGILKLSEIIKANGEEIKLTWNFVRIDGEPGLELFDAQKNNWRIVPAQAETEDQLKKRLSQMLRYYSAYFELIAEKSSYFIPARVLLPLRFYQHAIGMKDFDKKSDFMKLFYSPEQGERAFYVLKNAINKSTFDFPQKNSYSEEYSLMLNIIAAQILK